MPLSLADVQKKIMTDPTYGYSKTTQARSDAADLMSGLKQVMGFGS